MKQILFLFIALFLAGVSANAQAERITTINGKKYIIHTVEQGNTVYSISKTYSVDESFIIQSNPFLQNGLKVGQEIKIPLSRQSKYDSKSAPELEGDIMIHEVQKKETLYSLSRKYGLEIKDILEMNPEAKDGIKTGQKLKIPANKSKDTQSEFLRPANLKVIDQEAIQKVHIVKSKETLYSLARTYGITMKEIIDANKKLLEDGLKENQQLVIPSPKPTDKGLLDDVAAKDTGAEDQSTEYFTTNSYPGPDFSGNAFLDNYKVAVMLPFLVDEKRDQTTLGKGQISLDFYQGVLLALDSLKQMGMNLTVLVVDTKKDANYLKNLLNQPQYMDVNLFIGPFYRSSVEPVVAHASRINAHVVCPVLQSNNILFNNPNVSKVHPNEISQAGLLAKYIAVNEASSNLIIVNKIDQEPLERKLNGVFRATYFKYLPGGSLFGVDTVPTLFTNGYEFPDFEKFFKEGVKNIVFTASDDPVLAAGLMTHLKGYTKDYEIQVFGLEPWLNMDKIDSKNKNDLRLTVSSSRFVDFENAFTQELIRKYRSKYNTDPGNYGFLGFDIAYYYLKGMYEKGLFFLNEFPTVELRPVSRRFNLLRIAGTSGFENKSSFILSHQNYELKPLN